jgi:hypothetical protein
MIIKAARKRNEAFFTGHQRWQSWIMLITALTVAAFVYWKLSSTMNPFGFALLGTALMPLFLCILMHGIMMKFMMHQEECNKKVTSTNPELKRLSISKTK